MKGQCERSCRDVATRTHFSINLFVLEAITKLTEAVEGEMEVVGGIGRFENGAI